MKKTILGYKIRTNELVPKDFIVMTDKKKIIYLPIGMKLTKKIEGKLIKEIKVLKK